MIPIRPNGMTERIAEVPPPRVPLDGYGRPQPGPADPETLRAASRQDRRRKRRHGSDPLRGRLIDVTA